MVCLEFFVCQCCHLLSRCYGLVKKGGIGESRKYFFAFGGTVSAEENGVFFEQFGIDFGGDDVGGNAAKLLQIGGEEGTINFHSAGINHGADKGVWGKGGLCFGTRCHSF